MKQTRIERLREYAQARSVLDDPAALGALIGKKPNQVYNLLHGLSSFGEKVARSIEDAAGLPRYWLDSDEQPTPELSPEVLEIAHKLDRLTPDAKAFLLRMIRGFLAEQGTSADRSQKKRKQA